MVLGKRGAESEFIGRDDGNPLSQHLRIGCRHFFTRAAVHEHRRPRGQPPIYQIPIAALAGTETTPMEVQAARIGFARHDEVQALLQCN